MQKHDQQLLHQIYRRYGSHTGLRESWTHRNGFYNNWLEKKMLRKDWFMNGKDKLKATEEGRRQDAKYQRLSCYRKRRRLFKRSIKFGIQERNDVSESHPHGYGQG